MEYLKNFTPEQRARLPKDFLELAWTDQEEIVRNMDIPEDAWIPVKNPKITKEEIEAFEKRVLGEN